MKQVLQHLGNGETLLAEVPAPVARRGSLLIHTRASLVSLGTEKMLIDFGKAGMIDKARQQPEKVKQVIQKIKTEGLAPTVNAVKSKLDQPLALGYCNAGLVTAETPGLDELGFAAGDRVVSNGPHAEVVSVPKNLCAKIPDEVTFAEASFTVLGAIGLQGVRLLNPTLGETVAVTGLGLIGLMCVQLLRANGCRVIGIDLDAAKCEQAAAFGAEVVNISAGGDPVAVAMAVTGGSGVDGVLITASTKSSEPVSQAARMCRQRGRIVLVGVIGLELNRSEFYEKELSFQVSCSYGPGRYDDDYEQKGQDYPLGFVRWTEQRNFEAILQLMAAGTLDVKPLISHRFPFDEALDGYAKISDPDALGIVLEYPGLDRVPTRTVSTGRVGASGDTFAVIGAGNYTGQMLLPALAGTGARIKTIASQGGVSAAHHAKKFAEQATTNLDDVFGDEEVNGIIITTRHNSHAALTLRALEAGKHVYVEKPLCLTIEELETIEATLASMDQAPLLMVGFNRRFAPLVVKLSKLLKPVKEPKAFIMTVNAGGLPAKHWTLDPEVGGGRIVGEGCHFIDLLRHLAGAPIVHCHTVFATGGSAGRDIASTSLTFEDGSIGTVHYLSNGDKGFPKERLEVFAAGGILQLDNFRKLTGYGWPGFTAKKTKSMDKGHAASLQAFVHTVRLGGTAPIPLDEVLEISRLSIGAQHDA